MKVKFCFIYKQRIIVKVSRTSSINVESNLRLSSRNSYLYGTYSAAAAGIYNYPLLDYLSGKQASVWLESALQIKHSSGLQRGKTDMIDAQRIAFYAYRNHDKMKLWQPTRQVIKELKTLTALRSRLINAIKQPRGGPLKSSLQEGEPFLDKALQRKMQQCCQHSLKALDQDLNKVNKQLDQIIASDEELNRLFNLITSIEGVGAVTAKEVLITPNEFKNFTEPKRYACYVGVAPFQRSAAAASFRH